MTNDNDDGLDSQERAVRAFEAMGFVRSDPPPDPVWNAFMDRLTPREFAAVIEALERVAREELH